MSEFDAELEERGGERPIEEVKNGSGRVFHDGGVGEDGLNLFEDHVKREVRASGVYAYEPLTVGIGTTVVMEQGAAGVAVVGVGLDVAKTRGTGACSGGTEVMSVVVAIATAH